MASGNDRGRLGLGRRVQAGFQIIRYLGLNWALFRLRHGAERKLGLLKRRMPVTPWDQAPIQALTLASVARHPPAVTIGSQVIREADAILNGRFTIFSSREVQAGIPPDWFANVLGGVCASKDQHWTEALAAYTGDIKGVWELSRFGWAYVLARAYGKTGDNRYPECFWGLFEDWCANNPPNRGANWACGQEATFRLMAVVFAAEVFAEQVSKRPGREELLSRFVTATAKRVDANLVYALSQKNNHSVSECVGLITAALVLGGGGARASHWLKRGMTKLEAQLIELVYEDGSFSQHSLVYHRVLLHDLIWCHRRFEAAGKEAPQWLDNAGARALEFLMSITDSSTGYAPLFGTNDGANVLPLADGAFLDMRPVIQAGAAVFKKQLPLAEGPWDEAAQWMVPDLGDLPRVAWFQPPKAWHASSGGYLQLVSGHSRIFLRCPDHFRHRPSQADMLNVDVSWRGKPIAWDAGTYSYSSSERLGGALKSAALHNVLTVDGEEPMHAYSRFLYLPWVKGNVYVDGNTAVASHDGYESLGVLWSRKVSSPETDRFLVRDSVTGVERHRYRLHWRLTDVEWKVADNRESVSAIFGDVNYTIRWTAAGDAKVKLIRCDNVGSYGWVSCHYSEVRPAVSLLIDWEASGSFVVTTEFSPSA